MFYKCRNWMQYHFDKSVAFLKFLSRKENMSIEICLNFWKHSYGIFFLWKVVHAEYEFLSLYWNSFEQEEIQSSKLIIFEVRAQILLCQFFLIRGWAEVFFNAVCLRSKVIKQWADVLNLTCFLYSFDFFCLRWTVESEK